MIKGTLASKAVLAPCTLRQVLPTWCLQCELLPAIGSLADASAMRKLKWWDS